uniref:Ovule protein n=1 Tax=Heterorhabditis bacteriophora TaxID=37862 RepID=A0A1I7WDD9_HETBA
MKFITNFRLHFQATRLQGVTIPTILLSVQVSHPLWMLAPIKETSEMQYSRTVTPIRYSSQRPKTERFSAGLFPFHSPLLGES